ncbi:hypothetical protein [Glycomyces sp. YM15]|uniref:hypothetical protein n=1 Tax=Glycomyces sp. YM15 TaxID=2800446 RepID=UPI0019639C0A|nr:hypothetical protein [Glycomyces sp. YM15]
MVDQQNLERGEFRDSLRTYRVRVSSPDAPDSFQVYTGQREDIVLIVSGINSGDLKATWGPAWREAEAEWRIWVEECAFSLVIVGGHVGERVSGRQRPGRPSPMGRHMIERNPSSARFCDG